MQQNNTLLLLLCLLTISLPYCSTTVPKLPAPGAQRGLEEVLLPSRDKTCFLYPSPLPSHPSLISSTEHLLPSHQAIAPSSPQTSPLLLARLPASVHRPLLPPSLRPFFCERQNQSRGSLRRGRALELTFHMASFPVDTDTGIMALASAKEGLMGGEGGGEEQDAPALAPCSLPVQKDTSHLFAIFKPSHDPLFWCLFTQIMTYSPQGSLEQT